MHHLQDELRLAPLSAAGLVVTFSVLVVPGSFAAPRLIAALGWGRALGVGLGVIAAGNILLAAWPQMLGVGMAAGICGLAIGIGSVEAIKGTAAGVLNTAARSGTAIGTAVVLLIAATLQPRIAWAVAASLAMVAAVAAAGEVPHPAIATGR